MVSDHFTNLVLPSHSCLSLYYSSVLQSKLFVCITFSLHRARSHWDASSRSPNQEIFPPCMEHEWFTFLLTGLCQCLLSWATWILFTTSYPIYLTSSLILSCHLRLCVPDYLIYDFRSNLCMYFLSLRCPTCTAYFVLIGFILEMNSASCKAPHYASSPASCYFLSGPNTLLSIPISNTLRRCTLRVNVYLLEVVLPKCT